ncbi:MAG: FAD-dependent monooxygenase [Rubripirellula sp.]
MNGSSEPVLVVGGRTTGLMMAGELVRHGCNVRLIDKSPGIDPHSRATYLHARTLEILHGLGLADEIVAKGQPLKGVDVYANGKLLASSDELPVDSPFPFGAAFAQNKTEEILARHVCELGVKIERDTELLDLEQSSDHVLATIRSPSGAEEQIATPWVIGCDGAHSTTRKLLKESFPGEVDPMPYLCADVLVDGPIQPDVAYLCMHDKGDVFLFLLDEGRRQVIATLPRNSERTKPPSLEEMQQLVDERGFANLHLSDPRWLTTYRTHYRLVPHYRHRRVFLAGDAAHIHSVFGGQGMNTGIQDAHNLAWKLALVSRGVAPEWWLDTYSTERFGIAKDILNWTKLATEQFTLFADLNQTQRDRLSHHRVLPDYERLKFRTHEEELDLDYRSSRLCSESNEDGTSRVQDEGSRPSPHPGSRAVDAVDLTMSGQRTTLIKALGDPRHLLLLFCDSKCDLEATQQVLSFAERVSDSHADWLRVSVVGSPELESRLPAASMLLEDIGGHLRDRYDGDIFPLYLIRPDGYIGFRSQQLESLDEYLDRLLR